MNSCDVSWQQIAPGVRRLDRRPGPWFQYVDPVGYEWNVIELAIDGLPDSMAGYRILHLTDLHCWPDWLSSYDDLIARVAADPPDLLVNTGDYTEDVGNPRPSLPTVKKITANLKHRDGSLGILGNHDEHVTPGDFDGSGIRFIGGQRVVLQTPRGQIELIGMPGQERADTTDAWIHSIPAKTPGVPRVVLSHYPDLIRRTRGWKTDLFLAGHTHGGQVNLPGRIPVIRHDSLPIAQFQGVHRLGPTCLVVNRGFGFSTAGIRWFCPSEVIEIRLTVAG